MATISSRDSGAMERMCLLFRNGAGAGAGDSAAWVIKVPSIGRAGAIGNRQSLLRPLLCRTVQGRVRISATHPGVSLHKGESGDGQHAEHREEWRHAGPG